MVSDLSQDKNFTKTSLCIDDVPKGSVDFFDGYSFTVAFIDGTPDSTVVTSAHLANQLEFTQDAVIYSVP